MLLEVGKFFLEFIIHVKQGGMHGIKEWKMLREKGVRVNVRDYHIRELNPLAMTLWTPRSS